MILPSLALFSSSHLSYFSIFSLQLLFSISLDWSQTCRFAHYHKIMGCRYWADPGKTWPRNTTKTCIVNRFLFPLFMLISFSFFLLFFLHLIFLFKTLFLPASSNSVFPAKICYDQKYCSGISQRKGPHSLGWTIVSFPPFHQSQATENHFA